jgi:uncharacterized protein (TIGR00661 family)
MDALINDGYVIIRNIYEDDSQLLRMIHELSNESNTTNGFFDLYHDDLLAKIRQNEKIYEAFAEILDEPKLWVMFDRIIHVVKAEQELPLHVDQNPHTHPHFHGVQGLLALTDNTDASGTLTLISGSHKWFHRYKEWSNEQQGWVQYNGADADEMRRNETRIYLNKGDLVIWDSRLTHSRYSPKVYTTPRTLVMISYIKVPPDSEELRQERVRAFNRGIGVYNHDAGLRKTGGTTTPSLRVCREMLTPLGRKLYGLDKWDEKIKVRVAVVCEEYGFGPVSTAQKIAQFIYPYVESIDFIGTNYTCALQEPANYSRIHFLQRARDVAVYLKARAGAYDCVINVMDFSIKNIGIPMVMIDQLSWYWDSEVPVQDYDVYLAQRWLSTQLSEAYVDRLPTVLARAVPAQQQPRAYKVLLNFGGLINPFLSQAQIKHYVQTVAECVKRLSDSVKIIGNYKLQTITGLDIECVDIATAHALLQRCSLFIGTAGIGNICDVADLKKPYIWLPPTNPSQARQLEMIGRRNAIDWCDMPGNDSVDYAKLSISDIENYIKSCIDKMTVDAMLPLIDTEAKYSELPVSPASHQMIVKILTYLHRFNITHIENCHINTLFPVSRDVLYAHIPLLYKNTEHIRITAPCKPADVPHYAYYVMREKYISRGYFVAHAACVSLNGKVMLIVGKSGSGKTTAMLNYMKKGAVVLSTDKTVLDSEFNVVGGTRCISVRKHERREYKMIDIDVKHPIKIAIDTERPIKIDVVKLLTRDGECDEVIFSMFCDMERSTLTYQDVSTGKHVFLRDECTYEQQKTAFFRQFRGLYVVRKNILYGVCGIGAGHKYRSIPIIDGLLAVGHAITIATYGSGVSFFATRYAGNKYVKIVKTTATYYAGDRYGLSFEEPRSVNTQQKELFERDVLTTLKTIDSYGPYDLCLSDYEEMVAKYSYAKNILLITIDQQSKYLCDGFAEIKLGDTTLTHWDEVERLNMFFPKAHKRFAYSFFRVDAGVSDITILSPVVRKIDMRHPDNKVILIYISDQQDGKLLTDIMEGVKEFIEKNKTDNTCTYQFHIFTNSEQETPSDNIKIYKHGDPAFIDIFSMCGGVISTAGHMLLSECMHYEKPVYCIPMPLYEQAMNAKVIEDNHFGMSRLKFKRFDLETFLANLDYFRERIQDDTKILNCKSDYDITGWLSSL